MIILTSFLKKLGILIIGDFLLFVLFEYFPKNKQHISLIFKFSSLKTPTMCSPEPKSCFLTLLRDLLVDNSHIIILYFPSIAFLSMRIQSEEPTSCNFSASLILSPCNIK